MQARRSQAEIVLDFETTYGSDPAAPAGIRIPFNTFGLVSDRNLTEPETITGTRNPVAPIQGNTDVRGPAVVPVDVIALGYWLRALLGAPQTKDNGDGTYTHVFKPTDDVLESMVIDKGFTDVEQYFKFNGVKIERLAIEFGGDGELVANLDLLGANESLSQTPYDAAPSGLTFTRFNNFQAALKEGGVTLAYAKTLSLEVGNNLDPDSFVIGGGGIRGDLPEDVVTVGGTMVVLFQDEALYEKALNAEESSLQITLTNGANILDILLPEVMFRRGGPPIETAGGIVLTLPYFAYYEDCDEETSLQISLTNAHESYSADLEAS